MVDSSDQCFGCAVALRCVVAALLTQSLPKDALERRLCKTRHSIRGCGCPPPQGVLWDPSREGFGKLVAQAVLDNTVFIVVAVVLIFSFAIAIAAAATCTGNGVLEFVGGWKNPGVHDEFEQARDVRVIPNGEHSPWWCRAAFRFIFVLVNKK